MKRATFNELSLVPLADMLTNTVGVMLFILVFTVLATSGALVPKIFPIEQETEASPLYFVCKNNRLIPVELSVLVRQFVKNIENIGAPASYDDVEAWIQKYNAQELETKYFKLNGKGSVEYGFRSKRLQLVVSLHPRGGSGESVPELPQPDSPFLNVLAKYDAEKYYAVFLVYPDSIEAFAVARDVASKRRFAIGWTPLDEGDPIGISLSTSGGGRLVRPQIGG